MNRLSNQKCKLVCILTRCRNTDCTLKCKYLCQQRNELSRQKRGVGQQTGNSLNFSGNQYYTTVQKVFIRFNVLMAVDAKSSKQHESDPFLLNKTTSHLPVIFITHVHQIKEGFSNDQIPISRYHVGLSI